MLSVIIIERDAFDALFDNAPEKLNVVKKVLYLILLYAVQSKYEIQMSISVSTLLKQEECIRELSVNYIQDIMYRNQNIGRLVPGYF